LIDLVVGLKSRTSGLTSGKGSSGIDSFIREIKEEAVEDDIPVKIDSQGKTTGKGSITGSNRKYSTSRLGGAKANRPSTAKNNSSLNGYTADQTDKIYDLERENQDLKYKENILDIEILQMKAKLARVQEMAARIKKDQSKSSGLSYQVP
jgi:uncharacterized protein YuzE